MRNRVAKFTYDAFGRTVSQTGSKASIDINALNYRFYSPNLGRWISRDPIREQGGRNLYSFVGNDGVDQWDKLGLKECKFLLVIGRGTLKGPNNELRCDETEKQMNADADRMLREGLSECGKSPKCCTSVVIVFRNLLAGMCENLPKDNTIIRGASCAK